MMVYKKYSNSDNIPPKDWVVLALLLIFLFWIIKC